MAMKEKYNALDVVPNMDLFLLPRANGMLLSDKEVTALENNNVDYLKCKNVKELMFLINEMNLDDDDLDEINKDIEERDYYSRLVN